MSLHFFCRHCSISEGLPEKRENEFYFTHPYFEKSLVPQRVLPHHAGTSAKIQLQASVPLSYLSAGEVAQPLVLYHPWL